MANIGKVVLDLPPTGNNPRNSEGAFISLKNGVIMFVYSRFSGEVPSDDASAGLVRIYSYDEGETWTKEEVIVSREDHGAKNLMSLSLMRMGNGDVGLYYLIRMQGNDLRLYLRRSTDEGVTWGEPVLCTPAQGFFVINNDRVVKLKDGRIIAPVCYHRNQGPSHEIIIPDQKGETLFYISDDDGVTWRESRGKCALPHSKYSNSGLQEPGLIELENGVLWAWSRTDLCYQYEMFSFDKGDTWTTPQPSRFTSPLSPMSVKRMPNGSLAAIWNPIPNYNGRSQFAGTVWHGGRNPFVLALSKDEGNTWEDYKVIEDDPEHGYCYTAIHFLEDSMLLGYCAGGPEDNSCLAKLRIRKIKYNEIL